MVCGVVVLRRLCGVVCAVLFVFSCLCEVVACCLFGLFGVLCLICCVCVVARCVVMCCVVWLGLA